MDNMQFTNSQFTFHASWLKAIQFIKSKSVRARLLDAIINYGLAGTYTPIGNATADAILTLVIDQIDNGEGLTHQSNTDDKTEKLETIEQTEKPETLEDPKPLESPEILEEPELFEESETLDEPDMLEPIGSNEPSEAVDRQPRKRTNKSKKKKRAARRRKHR